MDRPRETPFFESINRPNLLMGADRQMVLFAAMMCVAVAISAFALWSFVIGGLVWPVALWVLRKLAKADPLMRDVYLRHTKYLRFYPAKSDIAVEDYTTKNDWR